MRLRLWVADCTVPPGKSPSLSENLTPGQEGGRKGGGGRREGVVSEQTELLNCAAQMKAAGH